MQWIKELEREISRWPQVSVHPHRFGGCEFLFGKAEIGHVHVGGSSTFPSLVLFMMLF
jgi:hypothetical protein